MSLKIEIVLPDDNVSGYALGYHMAALGFTRGDKQAVNDTIAEAETAAVALAAAAEMAVTMTNTPRAGESAAQNAVRVRGQPAPGRARRTKAEIAEDEASDAVDTAKRDGSSEGVDAQISSNPENRVGPEDDAETQAQDAADEQAEVEAHRDPETPLTVDDVKNAVGLYVTKFMMPATQEDGPVLFKSVLGDPPAGEAYWKMSLLPKDQAKLAAVIAAWKAAAASEKRFGA